MTKISDAEATALIARDERGEDLTAVEWSRLSVYHANEAVRHANDAVMWADRGLRFAYFGVAFGLTSLVLALLRVFA